MIACDSEVLPVQECMHRLRSCDDFRPPACRQTDHALIWFPNPKKKSARSAKPARGDKEPEWRLAQTILWDKRRPLPRYATAYCQMLAEHMREVFPITRPSEPKTDATVKRATARRAPEYGAV